MRKTWVCLGVLVVLLAAAPRAGHAAAGCCQYRDSCEATDDEKACTGAGGQHYQLGVCVGKICQPTVAEPKPLGLTAALCPLAPAPLPNPEIQ